MLTVGCHPSSWTFCCFSPVGQPKLIWHLLGGVGITPDAIMQKAHDHYYHLCMCNSTNDQKLSLFIVHYEIKLICFSIMVGSIEKAQEFCIETTALWVETVWNRYMQFIDINHFPMSSEVSERANAWAKWNTRAKLASEWVSSASNWAERRSKWPGT